MNSLVSYDWLSHYVDLKGVSPEEFARRLSLSGPSVERMHSLGERLNGVVVGHVVDVKKHPNADKLRIAIVDVGAQRAAPLRIVCGGSNLKKDQWVAVALVGAKIRWHGKGDLVPLEPAEIRGVKSEGMICAASEIGLADAFPHEEREILDLGAALPDIKVKPGTPLAHALGLAGDVVMDIEVTSNRVDAMGMVGMAREASAILGKKFLWKAAPVGATRWVAPNRDKTAHTAVTVHEKKICPRYMAVRLTGVSNGPSPWWMKRRLASAGLNSISRLVDITNYVMLEFAQPMHVFDAGKLKQGDNGPEIHVRLARPREKIAALDGREYALDDQMLVIADAEKPVAIAGVMGGAASGVSDKTTDIIFEAATFDPVSVRKTARRLNLYSDSQLRFEKGLSTEALPFALARAVELTLDLCGGKVTAPPADARAGKYKPAAYSIACREVSARIGVDVPPSRQVRILRDLGFRVSLRGRHTLHAEAPWWRDHDIESGQDLVEEIARVHGYANIPPVLPVGQPVSRKMDAELVWQDRLRTVAKGAGLTETYSYSFTSDEVFKKAGYDPSVCLHLQNPLTNEFAFMRTTLLPSLLQIVAENEERYRVQRLFEVANVYYPRSPVGAHGVRPASLWKDLPNERLELGCAFLVGEDGWREAKGFVEHLFHELGIEDVSWRRNAEAGFWHPGRSVQAFKNGKLVASIGEVSPAIVSNFKIMGRMAMIDCPLKEVISLATTSRRYLPPSLFPEAKRDLAVVVDHRVEYDDIARTIGRASALITKVEWFDTFMGSGLPAGKKSVAMHLTFSSQERTLTSEEVDTAMAKAVLGLKEKFDAEVRD